MHVGVLGGGMMGCATALALAGRGIDVTLFDRNADLLTRAAVANEGKVHIGFIYANDPTLATARMMMTGALAFAPFLERHLEVPGETLTVSRSAAYAVHAHGQRDNDQVMAYLEAVYALLLEASADRPRAYFGRDLRRGLRPWTDAEHAATFEGDTVLSVTDTPEVAINPVKLSEAVRARVMADPRIEVRLDHEVVAVTETDAPAVVARSGGSEERQRFDHVVNALWDGRLAVDATLGLRPGRPWLHRLKYGVTFRIPDDVPLPPSVTIVSGPFGEVVAYDDRTVYLTWYPACRQSVTRNVAPPDWPVRPGEPLRSEIFRGTLGGLSAFVRPLRALAPDSLEDVVVKGGAIVAWGASDIDDPGSGLHQRFEIGVTTTGNYHSVDPGKLTLAPFFAEVCADRIAGGGAS